MEANYEFMANQPDSDMRSALKDRYFPQMFLLLHIFRSELRECFEVGLPFTKVVVGSCRDFAKLQTFCTHAFQL